MARIRPARHYQRKDEPVRLIAEAARPGIRRDMHASLRMLSKMVPETAVGLARAGLWYRLKDEVAWGHFGEVLKAPFGRIGKTFEAGAALGVRKINGAFNAKQRRVRFRKVAGLDEMFDKALADRFNFDVYTPTTTAAIRAEQDRLIKDLTAQARDSIDAAIMFGARNGFSPEEIVQDIRNVIGLSEQLANAAMNYESALRNLNSGALTRALRDAGADMAVRDAMDAGVSLSEDQIQALTSSYIDNALDYRAGMIAQTESVRAASLGLQDAYQQAVDRGAVPEDAVTLNWMVALDERTCPVCLSIPDMNPDGIAMGEQFDSIDGPVDLPPVHPNAVFSGSFFVPYGGIERMVAAEYDGPAVTLLAGGHRTTIGPNHPMLTSRGMVKAKLLKVGDKLVYDRRVQNYPRGASDQPDLDKIPAVEQAFRALDVAFGHARVTAPADDLHGDVVFCKDEVDVVFPTGELLFELDPLGVECLRERGLDGADVKLTLVSDSRFAAEQLEGLLLPSAGSMGGSDVCHFVFLQITEVAETTHKGGAFDCTTASSLYCSDGFVVSNCRCSVEYITDLDKVPSDAFAA